MRFTRFVGREYGVRSCWELVRDVYRELYHVELPSYALQYDAVAHDAHALGNLFRRESDAWLMVPAGDEDELDVVLLRMLGEPGHVGVVIKPGWFLHARETTPAVVETYRSQLWARRVLGFYRYHGGYDVSAAG